MTAISPAAPRRTTVDWHSHIWLPEHLGPDWVQLEEKYDLNHRSSLNGTPEKHRAAMAKAGVDECLVIALWSEHLGIKMPNEYIARYVAEWGGKAVGLASVDPNLPSAVDDLAYAHDELGLRGLKLSPPYQNFHPHSPEAWHIYEAVAERGMLMFHQGAVTLRRGVLEVAQPVLLDRVAREFPDTTIIVAHMGQPWIHEVVPLMRKHPNVYADVSARCGRPAQLVAILRAVLDYSVADRLLWGSDFPVYDPSEHAADFLRAAESLGDIPDAVAILDDILYNRPLSYLGLGARTL
jgi:hypothetical protein